MRTIKPIQRVIDTFEGLPGIGPKTAARLAYYLLHVPQERLEKFGQSLTRLRLDTKVCQVCFNIGEEEICPICADSRRNKKLICVVEQPLDLLAFEKVDGFEGVYHVLGGVISPLNNISPEDLFIAPLMERIKNDEIEEVILATNPSMEGEATAMYITDRIKRLGLTVKISRIGRGLPTGAEVEYADGTTLARALEGRREV